MNYILKFLWTGLAHKHSSMIGHTVGKNKVLKLENKTNRMSKYLLYEIMIYVILWPQIRRALYLYYISFLVFVNVMVYISYMVHVLSLRM
jgi:hypothetical protein